MTDEQQEGGCVYLGVDGALAGWIVERFTAAGAPVLVAVDDTFLHRLEGKIPVCCDVPHGHHPAIVDENRARPPWYLTKTLPFAASKAKLRRMIIAGQSHPGQGQTPTPREISQAQQAWAAAGLSTAKAGLLDSGWYIVPDGISKVQEASGEGAREGEG